MIIKGTFIPLILHVNESFCYYPLTDSGLAKFLKIIKREIKKLSYIYMYKSSFLSRLL